MAPKRRSRRAKRQDEESEDTDPNVQVVTRKSSRHKQVIESKSKVKQKIEKQQKLNADADYDADSENDLNLDQCFSVDCKILTRSNNNNKERQQKRNSRYTKIKDLKVRLTDILSPKSSSSLESDSLSDNNKTEEICMDLTEIKPAEKFLSTASKQAVIETFMNNPKNKENVTPPDIHSTPALIKLAARKLDSSLFGFDGLDSDSPPALEFSPVVGGKKYDNSMDDTASTATFTSLKTKPSPSKRKHEQTGFYDVPIEMPKKRHKKRKVKQEVVASDSLENLRVQFEEVEMHELLFE